MDDLHTYSAFEDSRLLAQGPLREVVLKVKKLMGKADHSAVLIFSDATGRTMDFNFKGDEKEILKRLEIYTSDEHPKENTGPGRPKLGVISREVSLLPRHWEWLATQTGGASATLRMLVEEAKKKSAGTANIKQVQERTYRFMSVIAGDLEGYEEALRALYRRDRKTFLNHIQTWPPDIKHYALETAKPVFSKREGG